MKLKAKLMVAFVAVILLPIMLISCAGGVLLKYQLNSIEKSYEVESNTLEVLHNPLYILNRVTRGVYNEVKLAALKSPEHLVDFEYITKLNDELKDKYSFIVVRKNKKIIFSGNEKKTDQILDSLPSFGDYNANVDGGIYIGGKNSFLVKQQDFYVDDKQECSIFVITDVNTLVPQIKWLGIQICISFIVIIAFTAIIIILWLYQSMIRPLNSLRVATNRMKEGDLNFTLKAQSNDEIGMLCEDFEDMRAKLRELIETKLQYERNSRELISNISHDLKTPITAIKGYTEGILDGVADNPEKMDKYLKTIYTKANDMSLLVDELSLYSKLDCDTIPYNFRKVNVENYFSDCISELMLDLEVKNIDIGYFNYTEPSLSIIVDPEQLKRVVNNIIGNAAKYMDKKRGIINLRIHEEGEFVEINIEDNGKGISSNDLPHIFERFYRADASRNSSKGGSGLGLAIARKIIEDHGGRIWAKSKEGIGTTICFTVKKEEK